MIKNFIRTGAVYAAVLTSIGGWSALEYHDYKEGQNLAEKFSQAATISPQDKMRLKEILASSSPGTLSFFAQHGIGFDFSKAALPSGAIMNVDKNMISLNPDLNAYDHRCWVAPGIMSLSGKLFGENEDSFKQPVSGPYKLKV